MYTIRRLFSVWLRRIKKPLLVKRELKNFYAFKNEQENLPANVIVDKTLLVIKLDDIGDYILWRNSFHIFRQSEKWRDYSITLLGNTAWKSLFDYLDKDVSDFTIWINKNNYYADEAYRKNIWQQLRTSGFETVICASNTRPLLLDDLCMLAAAGTTTIASENTFSDNEVNAVSNALYQTVYNSKKSYHEFFFNQDFTNWCCNTNYQLKRPFINPDFFHREENNYILCYVGASKKSRRWPALRWVELIEMLNKNYKKTVMVSCGPAEDEMAEYIAQSTGAIQLPGKTSLPELLNYTAFAEAVITNNTMMAHLAPACNRPTLIIDNGDNFSRMTAYKEAGISNVETVYAKPFLKEWKKKKYQLFSHYTAISNDIKTISADDVLQALKRLPISK